MNEPESGNNQLRTIDLLITLSLAGDLALGLAAGHGVRATYIGMHLADLLGLTPEQRIDLFYSELLMDAGCTAWASQAAAAVLGNEIVARRELFIMRDPRDPRDVIGWLARYMAASERVGTRARRIVTFGIHGKEFMIDGLRNTTEVASRMAGRLGQSSDVQQALMHAFEAWDGTGPRGKRADSIPIIARILYATIFFEVFHHVQGRDAAIRLARSRRGTRLDPQVVDAFLQLASREEFWHGLESDSVVDDVRALEPESSRRYFDAARLDDAACAFGDFADLKSFYSAGHSRRVAQLVETIGSQLGLSSSDVATIRRAACLHDIGLVAVSSSVLHKPEDRLTAAEWESLRLHPYYAERILSRSPAFVSVIPMVAAHHERPDGTGYHRGLSGRDIPLGARIIAVADNFDVLTHEGPEQPALDPDTALRTMAKDVGTQFSAEPFEALVESLGKSLRVVAPGNSERNGSDERVADQDWPGGLTSREVEVLRVLATGASRRDMAKQLAVSEHTIRHHLEHIYSKIDVHTRVSATLFAIEHDLLV